MRCSLTAQLGLMSLSEKNIAACCVLSKGYTCLPLVELAEVDTMKQFVRYDTYCEKCTIRSRRNGTIEAGEMV